MSKSVYKYVGHHYLEEVIGVSGRVTLKCSYPKDFNDPYELFLTIDFKEQPDALAFYADVVGDIPQLPTTCFSRLPTVIPMWAHYAQNHQGFVIEFNEAALKNSFPNSEFGDVNYRDTPKDDLTHILNRASLIGRPRYLYLLQRGVLNAAYYTKASYWSYEQERRMVVGQNETRRIDDLMLMDIPSECVTALICGPRAEPNTVRVVRAKATQLGCKYFELKVGRSSAVPYFVDPHHHPFAFNGTDLEQASKFCISCKEPLAGQSEQCSLCQIDDSHRFDAASRNIYRTLSHIGLLEEYISGMDDSSRGADKGAV